MKGTVTAIILAGISILIAAFILMSIVSISIGVLIFAISLVILRFASDAFRNK